MNAFTPKPGCFAHFAIEADDLDRAKRFYAKLFGWSFEAWGPPGFFMISAKGGGVPGTFGSLQSRHHAKSDGGIQCTFAVADVDAAAKIAVSAGGKVVMPRMTIATVGHLVTLEDTEGNHFGIMQYDATTQV